MNNSIMQGLANNGFKPVDYVIFFIYLAVLIFLGFFVSRKKDGKYDYWDYSGIHVGVFKCQCKKCGKIRKKKFC